MASGFRVLLSLDIGAAIFVVVYPCSAISVHVWPWGIGFMVGRVGQGIQFAADQVRNMCVAEDDNTCVGSEMVKIGRLCSRPQIAEVVDSGCDRITISWRTCPILDEFIKSLADIAHSCRSRVTRDYIALRIAQLYQI